MAFVLVHLLLVKKNKTGSNPMNLINEKILIQGTLSLQALTQMDFKGRPGPCQLLQRLERCEETLRLIQLLVEAVAHLAHVLNPPQL